MPDDDAIQKTLQNPEFLKLGEDDQVSVLKHLRENASAVPSATVSTAPSQPDSIGGGFIRRAVDTAKGIGQTLNPVTTGTGESVASAVGGPGGLALYRTGKGIVQGYKQKSTDLATNIAGGNYGKAALNVAQLTQPAIGPASPLGSLVDTAAEGRYKEALGGAAFDATTLLLGRVLGKSPGVPKRIAKLTAATGKMSEGTGETIGHVLPELDETAKSVGKPGSVGDYEDLVQKTLDRHEDTFNQALQPISQQPVDTRPIAQRILSLVKSDSSPAERATIRKAANEYAYVNNQGQVTAPKPQTMQWLNDRRGRLNASTSPIWGKSSGAAATAMKSDLDMAIDRTARNAVADLQYDVMDRANPGQDFTALKSSQKSLWALKDQLNDQIKSLTDKELTAKGRTFQEKYSPHGYVGRHIGAYVSGSPMETHPLSLADTKVRQAFGMSGPKRAAAIAVLSAPIERLAGQDTDQEQRPGGMTLPPQP